MQASVFVTHSVSVETTCQETAHRHIFVSSAGAPEFFCKNNNVTYDLAKVPTTKGIYGRLLDFHGQLVL